MSVTVLDAATRDAVALATTQPEQLDAIEAAFAGDITVRAMAGAVVAEVCTYGTWVRDSLEPRGMTLGVLSACTVNVTDATITSFVFVEGGTPIFSIPAADASLDSPTTKTGRRTSLADAVLTKHRIIADATLPLGAAPTHALTFTVPDTATVDVPFNITIQNTGTVAETWSIAPPAEITLSDSTALVWPGATDTITGTATAAGSHDLTLVCAGATITGATQTVVASEPASGAIVVTGPSSGVSRTVSGMFEVSFSGTLTGTVVVTLSDGDSNSRVYSHSIFDALGTVTLTPSEPVAWCYYAPASSGSKSITVTNDSSLTNPAALAYTATAASGSATPFRLTRGGSTIGSYATLQACQDSGAWASGDVVKVAAGTYAVANGFSDVGAMVVKENPPGGLHTGVAVDVITFEAEDINDPPLLDLSWQCAHAGHAGDQFEAIKAGIDCHTFTMRGIHLRGHPQPAGGNGLQAGFWQLTDYLQAESTSTYTFDRCLFHGWGDGIKGRNHASSSFYVNSCVFIDNSDGYAGLHHDIYIDRGALLEVVGCTFIRTGTLAYKQNGYGHFVKSRCRATTVKASRLYAYMDSQGFGGANSLINTPCGGVVEITGNTLIDYGATSNSSSHNILRSGEQQFPTSGEENDDPLLLTHSYLIAQNTMLQLRGYPLGDGNSTPVMRLYHNNTGNPSGALTSSGVPTQALTGTGVLVDVTTAIRNNIVANYDAGQAAAFLSDYPNNTLAGTGQISEFGYYSGGTVAGSPAVNDADFEWAGNYLAPIARADTNRGGRSGYVPTWVPATAWQWTQIAGTVWSDVLNNSGGAVPSQVGDPVGSSYNSQWEFSGVAYSRKKHEMWLFGGGHDGTTINALSKWSLGSDSPAVSVVCQPTLLADRLADWALGSTDYKSKAYHTETNPKPKSAHAYVNNRYFDDVDEFVSCGIAGIDEPGGSVFGSFKVAGFPLGGSNWRADGYWPSLNTTVGTYGVSSQLVFDSHDRSAIYYARKYTSLFKYTSAGVATTIGGMSGGVIAYSMKGAAESATRALIGGGNENGGNTGWRLYFVDLTTGADTAVTVTGAWPTDVSNYQYQNIVWVPTLSKYFALICSLTGSYSGANINAIRVFSLTPTGSSTITASEVTLTGTPPTRIGLLIGMEYDPDYGVLVVAASPGENLFTLKVA